MASKSLTLLALSASTLLATAQVTISSDNSANCPDGWSQSGQNGGSDLVYCCPPGAGSVFDNGFQGCNFGSTTVNAEDPSFTMIASSLYAAQNGGEASPATNSDAMETESASMDMEGMMSSAMAEATGMSSMMSGGGMTTSASGSQAAETGSSSSSEGGAAAPTAMVVNALVGAAAGGAMFLL